MTCRKKPPKISGGIQIDKEKHEWEWDKVEWKKCNYCGFYHSNRLIPEEFWDREWIITSKHREKVGIVLVKGNRYLWITESYHNCYGFPKGEKEKNESEEECAKREFKEETGYDISDIDLSKCLKLTTAIENIKYIFFVVNVPIYFKLNTFPEDDVEITSCGWMDIQNVGNLKLSKAIRKIYNLYIKYLKENYKKNKFYKSYKTRKKIKNF